MMNLQQLCMKVIVSNNIVINDLDCMESLRTLFFETIVCEILVNHPFKERINMINDKIIACQQYLMNFSTVQLNWDYAILGRWYFQSRLPFDTGDTNPKEFIDALKKGIFFSRGDNR